MQSAMVFPCVGNKSDGKHDVLTKGLTSSLPEFPQQKKVFISERLSQRSKLIEGVRLLLTQYKSE